MLSNFVKIFLWFLKFLCHKIILKLYIMKKKTIVVLFFIIAVVLCLCWFCKVNKLEGFEDNNNNHCFYQFEKILYINLKNREDRKKQINEQLEKMNVPNDKIIRIDAVYNKQNGHIGCAKSHIKALSKAKELNLPNVVILEDDFVFTKSKKEINENINKFLSVFKDNWDVIQLTASHVDLQKINEMTEFKKVKSAMTSSGYIIKSNFYDKLINNLQQAVSKMETEMKQHDYQKDGKKLETSNALDQHWIPLQKKSKWFIFSDFIGTQGGEAAKSSIMNKTIEQFKKKTNVKETFYSKQLIYV